MRSNDAIAAESCAKSEIRSFLSPQTFARLAAVREEWRRRGENQAESTLAKSPLRSKFKLVLDAFRRLACDARCGARRACCCARRFRRLFAASFRVCRRRRAILAAEKRSAGRRIADSRLQLARSLLAACIFLPGDERAAYRRVEACRDEFRLRIANDALR